MNIALPSFTSKTIIAVAFVLLSLLLAAYAPMALSNAHAAAETQALTDLKAKATAEIDRRIANYQKTLDSLNNDQSYTSGGSITIINADGTSSTSGSVTQKNPGSGYLLPQSIKDKTTQMLQASIDELKTLKAKVAATTTLKDMQALAKNIDAQYQITQFTDSQALVSKGVNDLSNIFSKVQSIQGMLESGVANMKACYKQKFGEAFGGATSTSSPSASPSKSPSKSPSSSSSGSPAPADCSMLSGDKTDSQNKIKNAQSSTDGSSSIMSAIGSILQSAVSLFMTIIQAFIGFITGIFSAITGVLGGLVGSITGMLGGLGSVGSGALGGAGGAASGAAGGAGGALGGLGTSLNSILPQLSNATGMASNVSGLMGGATGSINGSGIPGLSK